MRASKALDARGPSSEGGPARVIQRWRARLPATQSSPAPISTAAPLARRARRARGHTLSSARRWSSAASAKPQPLAAQSEGLRG